jgi:hypothetical protein
MWAIIGTYALAKLAEILDGPLYQLLSVLSGHSLKHFFASAGGGLLCLALLKRKPIDSST